MVRSAKSTYLLLLLIFIIAFPSNLLAATKSLSATEKETNEWIKRLRQTEKEDYQWTKEIDELDTEVTRQTEEDKNNYKKGSDYYFGRGVPKDLKQAVYWWKKAAEQGVPGAQYDLGVVYYYGENVPKDYKQAAYWWKKAADQGYARAQESLKKVKGLEQNGYGNPQVHTVRKAVKAKITNPKYQDSWKSDVLSADQQFNRGTQYYFGRGVPKDLKQAVYWWKKAAENGNIDAQNNLGFLYANGQGVPQDYKQAAYWWKLVTENGSASASYNLGFMYWNGLGVPKDLRVAHELFIRAGENGDNIAYFNLAKMTADEGNFFEAVKWLSIGLWRKYQTITICVLLSLIALIIFCIYKFYLPLEAGKKIKWLFNIASAGFFFVAVIFFIIGIFFVDKSPITVIAYFAVLLAMGLLCGRFAEKTGTKEKFFDQDTVNILIVGVVFLAVAFIVFTVDVFFEKNIASYIANETLRQAIVIIVAIGLIVAGIYLFCMLIAQIGFIEKHFPHYKRQISEEAIKKEINEKSEKIISKKMEQWGEENLTDEVLQGRITAVSAKVESMFYEEVEKEIKKVGKLYEWEKTLKNGDDKFLFINSNIEKLKHFISQTLGDIYIKLT